MAKLDSKLAAEAAGGPPAAPRTLQAKATTPKKDYIVSSRKLHLTGAFVTHGPVKNGKSFFAGSASKFWPDDLSTRSRDIIGVGPWNDLQPLVLADMLWISYDLGATDGFEQYKIEVPTVNVREMVADLTAPKAIREVSALVRSYTKDHPECRWIVEDTASAKDRALLEFFQRPENQEYTNGGKIDKYAPFTKLKAAHIGSHSELRNTNRRVHYLCHSKAMSEATTPQQENVDATMELPGSHGVEPEITGQSLKTYLGDASLIGVCFATRRPGKLQPGLSPFDFSYRPFGGDAFEGGNRFQTQLPDKMAANMRDVLRLLGAED